jgi:hypothetical protein
MTNDVAVRNLTRHVVNELIQWPTLDAWNPGLNDVELFWNTDPEAMTAAELDRELIGSGAVASNGGDYDSKALIQVS